MRGKTKEGLRYYLCCLTNLCYIVAKHGISIIVLWIAMQREKWTDTLSFLVVVLKILENPKSLRFKTFLIFNKSWVCWKTVLRTFVSVLWRGMKNYKSFPFSLHSNNFTSAVERIFQNQGAWLVYSYGLG